MKPTPPQGTPPTSTNARREVSADRSTSHWYKRWLPIAIAVAVAALAYGVGRLQGALALRQADQRSADDRSAWKTSLAACETDRSLLEVRRSLALVAISLDRRNFGLAESQRQQALEAFGRPSLGNVVEVSELASKVRGVNLAVDPNPGSKREQVIAVSEALDRLVVERAGNAPGGAVTATRHP